MSDETRSRVGRGDTVRTLPGPEGRLVGTITSTRRSGAATTTPITLTVLAKNPGEGMRLKPVSLALDLGETFKTRSLDAYERLLMDTVKGNLTLFMRRDELDAAWRWVDPILAGWSQYDERPKAYIAGSWGPAASSSLIGRDGFSWHDEL